MKMQTGMRLEAEVWHAYRELCSRERLRPSMPIEEFLKLVLENGSALGFLGLARGAAKAQAEGVNAYVASWIGTLMENVSFTPWGKMKHRFRACCWKL